MTTRALSEDQWQQRIVEAAKLHGWRWAHFRAAKIRDRWVTPQSGDPGFPDLVLARDGEVIVAELKTDIGPFRPGQKDWLAELGGYGRLWRPADWDSVHEELRRPRRSR